MAPPQRPDITDVVGHLQYRIALAGGWIDQPFVSQHNPTPPGAMVVVAVEPQFRWMDRAGICGSTRTIALELWSGRLPDRDPEALVRELYAAENEGQAEPSGSQDMIGLIYPGVSRLDYDANVHDGLFPVHIESNTDRAVAAWYAGLPASPAQTAPAAPMLSSLSRQAFRFSSHLSVTTVSLLRMST